MIKLIFLTSVGGYMLEEIEESVANIIGGRHLIGSQLGALSLVRKLNEAHAYLILEQYHNGEFFFNKMHLVIKRGTEESANKKADVLQRSLTLDEVLKLQSQGLYSVTWSVTQQQIQQLMTLFEQEIKRVANNEIDYHTVGNASTAGLFGASLQAAQSESLRLWSIAHHKGSASEYLLRRGHNCYSWTQAMAVAIGVNPPTHWHEFFAKDPRKVLNGQLIGEDIELTSPNYNCSIS